MARVQVGQSALIQPQQISDNLPEAGSGLIPPGTWDIILLTDMSLLTIFWPTPEVG